MTPGELAARPGAAVVLGELRALGRGDGITAISRLAGGSIADAWLITYTDGTAVVGKTVTAALPGVFAVEAAGLAALRGTGYLATPRVLAATIDPAVSYTWAEVDLSMLWCSPRPPASGRFFEVYQELSPSPPGWAGRMPVLHLRELLSMIATFGPAAAVSITETRDILAPFYPREAAWGWDSRCRCYTR